MAQQLGVSPAQTAHLGDSATDVAAARNAGVAAWAVPYGYNAGRPITESKPDLVFDTLTAVAAHVLAARRWRGMNPPLTHITVTRLERQAT